MISFSVIGNASKQATLLRSGDFVTLRILRPASPGTWLAALRGSTIVISSKISLTTGQTIHARADWQNSSLFLRMVSGENIKTVQSSQTGDELLYSVGLPSDDLSRSIVGTMQRAGIRLESGIAQRICAVLLRFGRKDKTAVWLATMVLAKGLDPSPELLRELSAYVDLRKDSSSKRHGKRRKRQKPPIRVEAIKTSLRQQAQRCSVQGDALHLFNHLRSPKENWIIIPYQIAIAGDAIRGTIRLNTNSVDSVVRCDVSAETAEERWELSLNGLSSNQQQMTVRCDNPGKAKLFVNNQHEMPEKLRNLPLKIDDNQEDGEMDWFSHEPLIEETGVDELV